jgi:hypothetical protein
MAHYVPPDAGPAGLVLGWRPAEGAESLDATLAMVDRVLVTADRRDDVAGTEVPVRTIGEVVVDREPAPNGPAAGAVVGLGPDDWRGAPDLFLRAAARLRSAPTELAWGGVDPEDGRSFPYRFDAEHLGLADRMTWLADPVDVLDALGRAAVVVVTGRAPIALHPLLDAAGPGAFLDAAGVPVVGFATPALAAVGGATAVDYPDVAALAAAVDDRLAQPAATDVDGVLDALLAALLGGDR